MQTDWAERFHTVMQGRSFRNFAEDSGISASQVGAVLNRASKPGADTLIALNRRERVDINWLLTGEGAPYRVRRMTDMVMLEQTLAALDEDASVFRFPSAAGLLMHYSWKETQPDGSRIPRAELLLMEPPLNQFVKLEGLAVDGWVTLDDETWQALARGQIGDYELFAQKESIVDQIREETTQKHTVSKPSLIDQINVLSPAARQALSVFMAELMRR